MLANKKKNRSINILGFLRDHNEGVFIIGGETGSHYSGHGESWQKKWDEYLKQNYISKDLAIEKEIINNTWKPPAINKDDKEIIQKIENNLL